MSEENRKSKPTPEKVLNIIKKRPALLIGIFAFLIYFQTFFFGFVKLDDIPIIQFNIEYFSDMSNITDCFTRDAFVRENGLFYRPLQTAMFVLETSLAGGSPYIYHIVNVILHIITSIGVFLLFKKLDIKGYLPFLGGLIYAIHPLFTHAVSWIPGRNDLLITLFCVYSFIAYINFIQRKDYRFLIYHFLLFLPALFSKETAAVFPVVSLAYVFLFQKQKFKSKEVILSIAAWVFLVAFWFIVRYEAIGMDWEQGDFGFLRLLENSPVIPELIAKLFMPFFIIVLSTFKIWTISLGMLLIFGLVYLNIKRKNNNNKYIIFGLLWFVLLIIPGTMYSHFHSAFFYDYLDHRAYLPMIGILIVIADIIPQRWVDIRNKNIFLINLIIILFLSGYSFIQARNYTDPITFWQSAADSNPKVAGFHLVLGELLLRSDRYKEAERQFLISMKYQPDVIDSYCYLGEIYDKQKKHAKAVNVLKMALEVDSLNFFALKTMGKNYQILKMYDRAIDAFKKAHRIEPNNNSVIQKLIVSLSENGQYTIAEQYISKLSDDPSNARIKQEFYFKWAESLNPANKKTLLKLINKALSYQRNSKNLNRAGIILMQSNYKQEAITYWHNALDLDKNNIFLLKNLLQYYLTLAKDKSKAMHYAKRIKDLGGTIDPQIQKMLSE